MRIKRTISISEEYEKIAIELAGPEKKDKLFDSYRSLLIFAAFLGLKEGKKKTYTKKSKAISDIKPETFAPDAPRYWGGYPLLIALADKRNYEALRDTVEEKEDYISIFETYANGGLEIISDWLILYGDDRPMETILKGLQSIDALQTDQTSPPEIDIEDLIV